MSDKRFHIGDLLSVTDGRLLSPNHVQGVIELLSHMTGDSLMTHQLPLAADAMEPELHSAEEVAAFKRDAVSDTVIQAVSETGDLQ
jgi:hypothetical protein